MKSVFLLLFVGSILCAQTLPPATAAGQVPVSTGPGTIYTAQPALTLPSTPGVLYGTGTGLQPTPASAVQLVSAFGSAGTGSKYLGDDGLLHAIVSAPSGSGAGAAIAIRHVFTGAATFNYNHALNSTAPLYSCFASTGNMPSRVIPTDSNNVAVTATAASDITCSFLAVSAPVNQPAQSSASLTSTGHAPYDTQSLTGSLDWALTNNPFPGFRGWTDRMATGSLLGSGITNSNTPIYNWSAPTLTYTDGAYRVFFPASGTTETAQDIVTGGSVSFTITTPATVLRTATVFSGISPNGGFGIVTLRVHSSNSAIPDITDSVTGGPRSPMAFTFTYLDSAPCTLTVTVSATAGYASFAGAKIQ